MQNNYGLDKIDVEGNEFSVLRGMKMALLSGKVNAIHFEFNEMNVMSRIFFKDFYDFLTDYQFYRMLQDGLVEIGEYNPLFCEIFAYQNIVAIKK